jgi:hypothetical protein
MIVRIDTAKDAQTGGGIVCQLLCEPKLDVPCTQYRPTRTNTRIASCTYMSFSLAGGDAKKFVIFLADAEPFGFNFKDGADRS